MDWPDDLVALYQASYLEHVNLAFAMLGSRHEAEEVAQEAFLSARQRWSDVAEPTAYLRRAVVNGAIAVIRRREVVNRLAPDPPPPDEPERLVELRDALLRLPLDQRAAVVLRHVVGLDHNEIADILGCRPGTARSHLSRGLAALRSEVPR